MNHKTISIRPFIGATDYEVSRSFYRHLGFEEVVLGNDMCLFKTADTGFYLQKAYVKDWVDNTMIFLEVDDAERYYAALKELNLSEKYPGVRLTPVRYSDWAVNVFCTTLQVFYGISGSLKMPALKKALAFVLF